MSLKASGRAGTAWAGGRVAAALGPWRLEPREEGGWHLSAAILRADGYWLDQQPQTVRLTLGLREWVWRGVQTEAADGTLRAVLPAEHAVEEVRET